MESNSLQHFGVLGMKWGVRRAQDTSNQTKPKRTPSEDYAKSSELRSKRASELSTKELKDLTQRLQLEKQLKDLKPSEVQRGLNVVKSITAAGTTIAGLYALSNTPAGLAARKAVKNAMEISAELARRKYGLA